MDEKVVSVVSLFVLLSCLMSVRFNLVEVRAPSDYPVHNLDTGMNYRTIIEAVEASETLDGHTIFVENGVYFELIFIDKSISLIGESRESTIIDGSNVGTVVTIMANNTAIRNFTIRNSGTKPWHFGIDLQSVQDVKIEGNVITNTGGVYEISSNDIAFNDNIMNYNRYGLYVLLSNNNDITANVMENNHYGMLISECNGNILSNNTMKNNVYNFGILGYSLQDFIHDIDTSNTIDEHFIYYILNEKNAVIDSSTFPNAGYVGIVNSTYIKVNGLNLSNNWCTLLLAFVNDSTITNVNITDNLEGICLIASNNNTIESSRLAGNDRGLQQTASNNNTVIGNEFAENIDSIYLHRSNGNIFVENIIENSNRGIYLDYSNSYNNVIYHNNFIRNAVQVFSSNSIPNDLDNGLEGNYWSDYNGIDSNQDGIGDTSYTHILNMDNQDHYPLMGMFHSFNTSLGEYVNVISNSTIEDFEYFVSNSTIRMHVSNTTSNQTFGFCRVRIPYAFMNEVISITVLVNGTEPYYWNYTLYDDGNSRWIYFEYEHSTLEIIVIPEFPSFLILSLFMIISLFYVVTRKRFNNKLEKKFNTQKSILSERY